MTISFSSPPSESLPARRCWSAWLGSFFLHSTVLGLMGWCVVAELPAWSSESGSELGWSELEELTDLKLASELASSASSFSSGSNSTPDSQAAALQSEPTVPAVEQLQPAEDFELAAQESAVATSPEVGKYYGVMAGKLIGGVGDGNGLGNLEGDNFFGPPGDATTFVFVLDRSGSMTALHSEAEQLNRFQRLQIELINFISRLQESQQFYVIFFNETVERMPTPTLVPATEYNKARYLEWIARLRPEGMTDPRASLRIAMKMEPDQIYFLSDGDLSDMHRKQVLRLKPGKWKLNTYTFGSKFAEFMKGLADIHGGNYTMIR